MPNSLALERLLRSRHVCVSICTFEEEEALGLVREAALNLSRPLWLWSLAGGVRDGLLEAAEPLPNSEEPHAGLRVLVERDPGALLTTLDLAVHLRNERVLRAFRHLLAQLRRGGGQLVMIDYESNAPDVVRAYATPFELELPDEKGIQSLVRAALRRAHEQRPIEISVPRGAWDAIVRNLRGLTPRQIERIVYEAVAEDRRFDEHDLNHVLACKRRALDAGGALEYVEAPIALDEIGGLVNLKRWLAARRDACSERAVRFGLRPPRGILMLGVQGAGKSLCAKAVATAWQRPLLRLDVGSLYDRYVGESERRLRAALRQAEGMAPVVLWIDEVEKGFASAAAQSTDGGLSKRMFGALLTWMQEREQPVFLVATANDIEALPPELLRKGRFDEIFFVDLPDEPTRREILAIHLRKRGRDPAAFDLDALAAAADGFSGAEIEAAITAALYAAFEAGVELDARRLAETLRASPPLSVTMAERVAALRSWAAGRCVPAG